MADELRSGPVGKAVSKAAWESAVARGDVVVVRRLLDAGFDVDDRDVHGQTALMRAAHRGHLDVIQALVARRAALDVTAKYRLSALMLAIVAGHAECARVLAQAGADLAVTGSGAPGFAGKTAYDLAAGRGDMDDLLPHLRPAWHALLAPLPGNAILRRQPVASPEVLASPHGDAIAGWQQITIEMSAGAAGLRHVLVVLDADGQPISANDTVLFRRERPQPRPAELRQQSLGGRLEPDGTFRGTRWESVAIASIGDDEPRWDSTPSTPGPDDVAGITALVTDVLRRLARER